MPHPGLVFQVIPEGGEIKLKSETNGDMVSVIVSDNGHGILPENLEKIFDPFFTTKEKGAGLGLSIVKKIVDMYQGTIDVQSEPDKGTTFTITLVEPEV